MNVRTFCLWAKYEYEHGQLKTKKKKNHNERRNKIIFEIYTKSLDPIWRSRRVNQCTERINLYDNIPRTRVYMYRRIYIYRDRVPMRSGCDRIR